MAIAPDGRPAYRTAIEEKVLGAGWGIGPVTSTNFTWSDFRSLAEKRYIEDSSWSSPLSKIANDMAIGDLVWIYDSEARSFFLGKLKTDWVYSQKEKLTDAGLYHVRGCEWYPVTLGSVPGAALTNRSIIRQLNGVTNWSKLLWNQLSKREDYQLAKISLDDIWCLVSHEDCEDIIALYLQLQLNMSVIPSTCKRSTPLVEFAMMERSSGDLAYAQVKSGNAVLRLDKYEHLDGKIFLFSSSNNYAGIRSDNVELLDKRDIEDFLLKRISYLPPRIRYWVDLLSDQDIS
jgi:hypothetical protein